MGSRGRARERERALVLAAAIAATAGCAARQHAVPPLPPVPEVRFVPPCDPAATLALTAEGRAALVRRDAALRRYIAELRSLLQDE